MVGFADLEDADVVGLEPALGWAEAPSEPSILLVETDESGELHWAFILGGRFLVQWPFREFGPVGPPEAAESRYAPDLVVVDGVVEWSQGPSEGICRS